MTASRVGGGTPSASDLADFAERCRSAEADVRPNPRILAKCASFFQQQGAQFTQPVAAQYCASLGMRLPTRAEAMSRILGR